jgi:glucose/mannose-6-phosphate isomerase
MEKVILGFPKQFKIGTEAAKNLKISGNFKGICICGMGGSALPGNLLNLFLKNKDIDIPLILQRNYNLPNQVKRDWLVIFISYSGNTEEPISCFEQAKKKGLKTAFISSGGKMETLAKKHNIPCALIPKGIQPRMALGYQFSALIQLLKNAGIIKTGLQEILSLEKALQPRKWETQGKALAKKLSGKIPLIYASGELKILARIWKIKFNENSKTPAFWNYFPEMNHNEMVGFEKRKTSLADCGQRARQNAKFYFIILQDENDHSRIRKRMTLTAKLLKKQGLAGEIINLQEKSLLEKTFSAILLSDWASYYLALQYNTDPEPVELVEEFKKLMEK